MPSVTTSSDIILIGAGVMSGALGTILHDLDPTLRITVIEALSGPGFESSDAWNNAGTGHAGNCELNYTPQDADGTVRIGKALDVNVEFELSRQLWSHWVRQGRIADAQCFIQPCPHVSLVWGAENVSFLRARFEALSAHHCFEEMEYSEDRDVIASWAPLTMAGRDPDVPVAATRLRSGSDVDYGSLTRNLFSSLGSAPGVTALYHHKVIAIAKESDGTWCVRSRDREIGSENTVRARFVFIGAGGGALPLLQKSGIPEADHYAGFPVSGLWLQCTDPGVARHHHAKVYGKAAVGAPPMSVPHLDTRVIDGQSCLLFGPYAGFSTRFLKHGSWTDYFRSLNAGNIVPAIAAGLKNIGLVRYLIGEVLQSDRRRFEALRAFYPQAERAQWKKVVAGQRVQIIRPENGERGVLKLGTELVLDGDRTLAAVLGASPGASVAAAIALRIVESCFPHYRDAPVLREMFPTYGTDLRLDAEACRATRAETARTLGLEHGLKDTGEISLHHGSIV